MMMVSSTTVNFSVYKCPHECRYGPSSFSFISSVVDVAVATLLLPFLTMGQVLRKLLEVFYTKKLDIVVIGLENRYEIRVKLQGRAGTKAPC